MINIYFVVLISFLCCVAKIESKKKVVSDSKLTTPELIAKYGYPQEIHHVITEDGYILELHRIVASGKQPVILMHGLLDSSAAWILLGPKRALGYILSDLKYDVWLPNARGNVYSKKHEKYKPTKRKHDRKKYWNFSWHEIGKYDLPAIIDYITAKTKFSKLHYIGHSQGTTSFFVMASERPEYNEKILLMTALAPPVYMAHVGDEFIRLNVRYLSVLQALAGLVGFYEFNSQANQLLSLASRSLCYIESLKQTQLCNNNFSPIVGNITEHVNRSLIPVIEGHAPADAAIKQFFHYGQLIANHRFCKFNYGLFQNLKVYGQRKPPDYSLKNCTSPVAIVYADKDTLAAAKDVKRLPYKLPNLVEFQRVDDDTFNHVDFIWATDAKELVYDYVIKWMRSAEKQNRKLT